MITCEPESLVIQFPTIPAALNRCAEGYIREWLPRLVAADLPAIGQKLLATEFGHWSVEQKTTAIRALDTATPERIAARFRKMVMRQIETTSPTLEISFQRTLRLPDDGQDYPLPPGLGSFPLRRIERHADRVPADWLPRGGVLMPMYQAEALWLSFDTTYPIALKVGTGMTNAVSGQPWGPGLSQAPQNYVVLPEQPWLDGYCVAKGVIRQFVAARLGDGYTAEEQICGTTRGGLQLEAIPLRPEAFFRKDLQDQLPNSIESVVRDFLFERLREKFMDSGDGDVLFSMRDPSAMGLGAGGTMRQEIYEDPWEPADWDLDHPSRVWIHLCDAVRWLQLTGELPPQDPITAQAYARHGLPWFDYYRDDMLAIEGSPSLAKLKSVFALAKTKGDASIPQEQPVTPAPVVALGPHAPGPHVAEWDGN